MASFYLMKGDITRTASVDAIVTLINSEGAWFGGVDGAIQRVAGGQYHAQAGAVLNSKGLRNGQTVVAKGNRGNHRGSFDDVIFVVDDLKSPLGELVYTACKVAKREGYGSIALPLMRTGVMLGAVEPDVKAVVKEMRKGFDRFAGEADSDMEIYVVVYDDPEAVKLLATNMKLLNA
jgi:O-acetyl-ADP-ribose deacetylase (regulator of RNase III)